MLRSNDGDTAYCTLRNGVATGLRWAERQADVEGLYRVLGSSESPETGVTILAGTVTSHVDELWFTNPGQPAVRAEIKDGAFAARLTGPPTATPQRPRDFLAKVNTLEGLVLYQGPAR